MGEAKIRQLSEIEQRAALRAREQRRSRIKDRFNRAIEVGDAVLLTEAKATDILWRVMDVKPAVEPQAQGGYWVDVIASTRVLFRPGVPSEHVILVHIAPENAENAGALREAPEEPPPGPARSPGGIILSDPDRISER